VPPNSHKLLENTDLAAAFDELQEKLPGLAEVMEPMNPGTHTTETVDFDVILSGEVYLGLDDGVETLLKAGDCIAQNGTRHAWHNPSSQNCVVAVATVGADHVRRSGSSAVNDPQEISLGSDGETKPRGEMLAFPPGLFVPLGRVQFLAEYPGSPVRYRLRGFGQLAADELCYYAVATSMRGIVVHDQIIGVLTDFEEILWRLPIGVNHT
jgi:hypothetical protein